MASTIHKLLLSASFIKNGSGDMGKGRLIVICLLVILLTALVLSACASGRANDDTEKRTSEVGQNNDAAMSGASVYGLLTDESKWAGRMNLPSFDDADQYETQERSPYVVCEPVFDDVEGFKEYAVDFRADSLPRGTYLCVCNLDLDMGALKAQYADVRRDYSGVAAYAGFQVWEDGTTAAIMSVWDTYVQDSAGATKTLRAEKIYPENPEKYQPFGGEGGGMQCMVKYNWEQGKTYRALIQCGTSDAGTDTLSFSVCDLTTGTWTNLITYDLGYSDTFLNRAVVFLEDYLTETAGHVRTMELSNFRVMPSRDEGWVSTRRSLLRQYYENPAGSYNFGVNGDCFWAITSGVPNLAMPPADNQEFEVSETQTGAPY